jgi:hypothetical protein
MNKDKAITILRRHFDKSSTHQWKEIEEALDYLDLSQPVNDESLVRLQFDIQKAIHDFCSTV